MFERRRKQRWFLKARRMTMKMNNQGFWRLVVCLCLSAPKSRNDWVNAIAIASDSALTEPNRQKSRREKRFRPQKSQLDIANRLRLSIARLNRNAKSRKSLAISVIRDGHRNHKSQKSLRFRCAKVCVGCSWGTPPLKKQPVNTETRNRKQAIMYDTRNRTWTGNGQLESVTWCEKSWPAFEPLWQLAHTTSRDAQTLVLKGRGRHMLWKLRPKICISKHYFQPENIASRDGFHLLTTTDKCTSSLSKSDPKFTKLISVHFPKEALTFGAFHSFQGKLTKRRHVVKLGVGVPELAVTPAEKPFFSKSLHVKFENHYFMWL